MAEQPSGFSAIGQAMRHMTEQLAKATEALQGLAAVLHQARFQQDELEHLRARYGGEARDARRWPDQWRSTVCAGLLCHVLECSSDRYGLECSCHCHQKERP